MRVAFVLDTLGVGGAERSTALVLPWLIERGVSPTVVLLRHEERGSEAEVRELGVPVHLLDGSSMFARTRSLRRVLDEVDPEIVHTAVYSADQIGRLASFGKPTKVISTLVNVPRLRRFRTPLDPPAWKVDVINVFDAVTGRLFVDRYQAVTPGVARLYAEAYRIDPSRIAVVERGRPLVERDVRNRVTAEVVRDRLGLRRDQQLVVAAGRHEHQKAHVDLIRAVSDLAEAGEDVTLLIAGRDGNATGDIHRCIEQTPGAATSVRLLGHRDDVPALLAAADVMALSSIFEGTAGVALEAMAVGTPIVSTRLEGMAGILEHERNSLIVEPRDPQAMAAAILRLLRDPLRGERLAAEAKRDFLDRFTLERSADRLLDLYRSVIGSG